MFEAHQTLRGNVKLVDIKTDWLCGRTLCKGDDYRHARVACECLCGFGLLWVEGGGESDPLRPLYSSGALSNYPCPLVPITELTLLVLIPWRLNQCSLAIIEDQRILKSWII